MVRWRVFKFAYNGCGFMQFALAETFNQSTNVNRANCIKPDVMGSAVNLAECSFEIR